MHCVNSVNIPNISSVGISSVGTATCTPDLIHSIKIIDILFFHRVKHLTACLLGCHLL